MSISWSIVFLTLASIYLYIESKKGLEKGVRTKTSATTFVKDFVFVWVLLGLLSLYIVSINGGSSILFAAGNIITEIVLVIYAMKNRTGKPGQK
jgi:hypothetical protein